MPQLPTNLPCTWRVCLRRCARVSLVGLICVVSWLAVMGCPGPVLPCCTLPAQDASEATQAQDAAPLEKSTESTESAEKTPSPEPIASPDQDELPPDIAVELEDRPESTDEADAGEALQEPIPEEALPELPALPERPPLPESVVADPRCAAGVQASPEVCDGLDNDCDGQIDEDLIGCVGTLAGTGLRGSYNARGVAASFASPAAIVVGPFGHLWIADVENHVIRKLDRSTNEVTTYAGTGQPGMRDGPAAQAQFFKPGALAFGPAGALYVADTVNHRIRKIDRYGQVTTVAGSQPGLRDGIGAAARLYFPSGIALGQDGTIFVADTLNHCLRKIDKKGMVTVFAGTGDPGFANGQGKAAKFFFPLALAIDKKGYLFVADGSNNMIRKISPTGLVSTLAGEGPRGFRDGAAGLARFYYPPGVTVASDGIVYVADANNQRIRRIALDGTVTSIAGTGKIGRKDGPALQALFYSPTGIFAAHDRLYMTGFNSHSIRMLRLR